MTPVFTEPTVDEVLDFWRNHHLAGYDVTTPADENAHWRSRALTIQDAIVFLESQKKGNESEFAWFDFKSKPCALSGEHVPLFMDVRSLIPNYEEVLEQRDSLAAQDYRERGDKV